MENSKIIIAAVAGAAAGAIAALLFAPEAGTELRTRIKDGARKFTDDLKSQIQEGVNKFQKTASESTEFAGDVNNTRNF